MLATIVDPGYKFALFLHILAVVLAGIYLLADGPWKTGDAFIGVGFLAIIVLFGLQHGFFRPQSKRARELAERDLESGDSFSDEFMAISERLSKVGSLAGLIVVVTVFFMAYKPFL